MDITGKADEETITRMAVDGTDEEIAYFAVRAGPSANATSLRFMGDLFTRGSGSLIGDEAMGGPFARVGGPSNSDAAEALPAEALPADALPAEAVPRPNIVLILTDDQDIQLGGMEPMAAARSLIGDRGVTGSAFYVNTPVCCPSRSQTLSGRYAHNLRDATAEPWPRGQRFCGDEPVEAPRSTCGCSFRFTRS